MKIEHLIDGKPVASDHVFETINPATQEVLAEVASGGAAEVDAAVRAAREAFPAWAGRPAEERAKLLDKLADLILRNVDAIADAESRDTGQPIAQTGKGLIPRAAAIDAGMSFVNSQNVRDLRQPFGDMKASGVGREGGTYSYEVFLEPKNVCVSLGAHIAFPAGACSVNDVTPRSHPDVR